MTTYVATTSHFLLVHYIYLYIIKCAERYILDKTYFVRKYSFVRVIDNKYTQNDMFSVPMNEQWKESHMTHSHCDLVPTNLYLATNTK